MGEVPLVTPGKWISSWRSWHIVSFVGPWVDFLIYAFLYYFPGVVVFLVVAGPLGYGLLRTFPKCANFSVFLGWHVRFWFSGMGVSLVVYSFLFAFSRYAFFWSLWALLGSFLRIVSFCGAYSRYFVSLCRFFFFPFLR